MGVLNIVGVDVEEGSILADIEEVITFEPQS